MNTYSSNFLLFVICVCLKQILAIPRWQARFGDPSNYMKVADINRCSECLDDVMRIRDDPWWCNHEVVGCCYSYFGETVYPYQVSKPVYKRRFFRQSSWCCDHCMSGVGQHAMGIENPWDCNFECGQCCYSWCGQSPVYKELLLSPKSEIPEKSEGEKDLLIPEFRS